jgi:hypothetical protein
LLVLKISSEISGEISVEDVVHELASRLHLGRGKEIGEEGRRSCSRLCPRIPAATLVLHASGHELELLNALAEVLGGGIAYVLGDSRRHRGGSRRRGDRDGSIESLF